MVEGGATFKYLLRTFQIIDNFSVVIILFLHKVLCEFEKINVHLLSVNCAVVHSRNDVYTGRSEPPPPMSRILWKKL